MSQETTKEEVKDESKEVMQKEKSPIKLLEGGGCLKSSNWLKLIL